MSNKILNSNLSALGPGVFARTSRSSDDYNNNKEDMDEEDDIDNNNNNNFSALGFNRDLGLLRGLQGQRFPSPHPDDDNNKEEDEEDNNNNDDNNLSALGLDGDLGFSRQTSRQ